MFVNSFYSNLVLKYPRLILVVIALITLIMSFYATKLEIDASSETLILEDDKDLKYSQLISKRYETPDFLVIAFTPNDDLFSKNTINKIVNLSNDLEEIDGVDSVVSIANVPLLQSPPMPLPELIESIPNLLTPNLNIELAKKEFSTSPLYRENLVSSDLKTTALLINITDDEKKRILRDKRNEYRNLSKERKLTTEEGKEFEEIKLKFKKHRDLMREQQEKLIYDVRQVIESYRQDGELFLGGIPMIANDVVSFVKNDLQIFGLSIFLFLIITLSVIFRQVRWIILPVLTCSISVVITSGILGFFGWEVTVISSNFISLQLIITMAITIHLIVRYREIALAEKNIIQKDLILKTILLMGKPCLYTVLTTIAGFSSLILSGLLPVINFGWMMSAGVSVSLLLTFILFPALQLQFSKLLPDNTFDNNFNLPSFFAYFTEKYGKIILLVSFVLLVFSLFGASKLRVENSFIDYFKSHTEIHRGMKIIDQKLGGTTVLDVLIDFDNQETSESNEEVIDEEMDELDDLFDELDSDSDDPKYWFTMDRMSKIEKLHDYLDSLDETGNVTSFATILKVGKTLNNGKQLDSLQLALLYEELPEMYKNIILNPYISTSHNQARISLRIKDSDPNLRRNLLINKMNNEAYKEVGVKKENISFANMLVLYNNMLQSLYKSQILTLGLVLIVLLVMFLILFRSFKIALIALLPNLMSIGTVLGIMGWYNIPLDMMTITIAAISMGIAVDNTIHYIYRFKTEYIKDKDYVKAMLRSHNSIGYAMYYTSLTIIVGFSILVFSNFIPSIYFGLLTGLAMLIALIASLTLVPRLLILLKPLS